MCDVQVSVPEHFLHALSMESQSGNNPDFKNSGFSKNRFLAIFLTLWRSNAMSSSKKEAKLLGNT